MGEVVRLLVGVLVVMLEFKGVLLGVVALELDLFILVVIILEGLGGLVKCIAL